MSAVLDTPQPGPGVPSTGPPAGPASASAPARRRKRPRLVHVDAMRPIKQFGVVSTHSLQNFAPQASLGVGASLMLTHVTRFAFMFISAAMLVYAYPAVGPGGWRTFWRRRLLAVVLPYVTWTIIYFALGERSEKLLSGLKDWMSQHNAVIMSVLCVVIAAKLIGDGISGLAG